MKKGEVGTIHLNAVLQRALNPSKLCIRYGGTEFRLGDKVMQVRNNYDKNVFNGGTGTITDVKPVDRVSQAACLGCLRMLGWSDP
jgi:exodeoxyribonuclease V alpha subunit